MKERRIGRAIAMEKAESKAKAEKLQKMKKAFQDAIQSVEESAEKAEEMFGKRDAPSMKGKYQKDGLVVSKRGVGSFVTHRFKGIR